MRGKLALLILLCCWGVSSTAQVFKANTLLGLVEPTTSLKKAIKTFKRSGFIYEGSSTDTVGFIYNFTGKRIEDRMNAKLDVSRRNNRSITFSSYKLTDINAIQTEFAAMGFLVSRIDTTTKNIKMVFYQNPAMPAIDFNVVHQTLSNSGYYGYINLTRFNADRKLGY